MAWFLHPKWQIPGADPSTIPVPSRRKIHENRPWVMVYSLLKKRVGRRKSTVLARLIVPSIIDLGDNCRIYVTDGHVRDRK